MRIKPTRSFTDDINISDYPGLKLYWDSDDVSSKAADEIMRWVCRVTGNTISITPAAGDAILKDAYGIYAGDVASLVVTGIMPTILATHYAVLVSLGNTTDASTVNGTVVTLGDTTGIRLNSIGAVLSGGAAQNTVPTLSPAALTTGNKPVCSLSYFDFVDTTSPRIDRVISNNNFADAVSLSSGSGTTTSTGQIPAGAISKAIGNFPAADGTAGARQQAIMLFLFTTPLTLDALKLACITMAKTRKPYIGWNNKT